MKRPARTLIFMVLAVALVGAFIASPSAWATPSRNLLSQTVPSPTPPSTYNPTDQPPGQPPTAVPPGVATVTPLSGSPTPAAPGTSSALALTLEARPNAIWPGGVVAFTLTVRNTGRNSLSGVELQHGLPEGLEPLQATTRGASYTGRILKAGVGTLPASQSFAVSYTARVSKTLPHGGALLTQAAATATGLARVTATLALALPPVELPPTGGNIERRYGSVEKPSFGPAGFEIPGF